MRIINNFVASIFAIVFIASCGGGGGGGAAAIAPGVVITQANAPAIASEVLESTSAAEGSSGSSALLVGVVVNTSGGSFNYTDFVTRQLGQLLASHSATITSSVVGAALGATSVDCSNPGGSVTVSGNITDTVNLAQWYVGDTLSARFFNCIESGLTLNGEIRFTVTTAIPNGLDGLSPYTLGMSVTMVGFLVQEGTQVVAGNGDVNILITDDIAGSVDLTVSGNSLTSTINGESFTLSNYQYDISENSVTGDYSFEINGIIATSKIGGSVIVTTTTPFTGSTDVAVGSGSGEPSAGVMLITNSVDNSSARLTAVDDINVMIEVDEDGDTIYEVNNMTTWAALAAL